MAGDYIREGFVSPAKISKAGIIECRQVGLITHLLIELKEQCSRTKRFSTARTFLCYNVINGGAIGIYHAKAQKEILWGEINVRWLASLSA